MQLQFCMEEVKSKKNVSGCLSGTCLGEKGGAGDSLVKTLWCHFFSPSLF